MAHPAPRRSVPTNIGESPLKVPVGRAERHLLNGLVDDQAFGVLVHDTEAVAVDVQDGTDGFTFRTLKNRQKKELKAGLIFAEKIIRFSCKI